MFIEIHHPATLEEALALLARGSPPTVPLGQGVYFGETPVDGLAAVRLDRLGLDAIHPQGIHLELGAMVTLDQIIQADEVYLALQEAVRLETLVAGRGGATLAETLVTADGGSPLVTVLLALDARLSLQPGGEAIYLGDYLPFRTSIPPGTLITHCSIPANVRLAFQASPAEDAPRPVVSVGVACWPSGRTRVALGGCGPAPILAFDSPENTGVAYAVEDAFSRAGDSRASAEFRQSEAVKLARAALEMLKDGPGPAPAL